MIKSLIINPPFLEPHRPPISCAILAEILEKQNHYVTVKDFNIEIHNKLGSNTFHDLQIKITTDQDQQSVRLLTDMIEWQLSTIEINSYDWILLSCFSFWNLEPMRKICQAIRSKTNAKIIIGGPGVEYENAGLEILNQGLVDFCIYGEAELTLPRLVNGDTTAPGVNGIPPEQIIDIENLPLPNYKYFDFSAYDWLLDDPDVFIYGSRGCVRKCTFCDVAKYWPKYRWRSGQSLANEMISNYEKFGVKNYFFADSLVNGNLKEFRTMCELLANYKEGLFRWASYAIVRPKSAHSVELFDLIKASGGKFWSIGIETGVDRIRFEMDKKFTNDDIDWHLEQSQRIGLQNNFLCIGTWPSETLDEHHEYLRMFKRWQNYAVDGTIYGIRLSNTLTIFEGTPLYDLKEGKIFEFETFSHNTSAELIGRSWYVPTNPDLTHHEKYRRVLALYEEAIKYNWPITNCLQSLHELKSAVISSQKHEQYILPRKIIPLIATK
jgi:hypothetical protein